MTSVGRCLRSQAMVTALWMMDVVVLSHMLTRTLVAEGISKERTAALLPSSLNCLSMRSISLHLHIKKFILMRSSRNHS